MTKTGPASVLAGNQISWQIQIRNAGPSAAREVTVADSPPDAVTDVTAAISDGGSCSPSSLGSARSPPERPRPSP